MIHHPTPCLKLAEDVQWVATEGGVLIYSPVTAVFLEGPHARLIAEIVLPLLDGTRTSAVLQKDILSFPFADIDHVLNELRKHSLLIEKVSTEALLQSTAEKLGQTKIGITGIQCWAKWIAESLASAELMASVSENVADASADLAIGFFRGSDFEASKLFAATCAARGIASIVCIIHTQEIIVSPAFIPGHTGCWNCVNSRLEANAAPVADESDDAALEEDPILLSLLTTHAKVLISREAGAKTLFADQVAIIDRASGRMSRHRFLPLPSCEICSEPVEYEGLISCDSDIPPPKPPMELALSAISCLVDARTGVVNRIVLENPAENDLISPVVATAFPAAMALPDGVPIGWGKSMSAAEAIVGALGETVERYAASLPPPTRLVWSKPDDLAGDVLDPRQFALYSDEQYNRPDFPYVRFDSSVCHPWVAGKWLGNGNPVWVPATLTYLALVVRKEHLFCQGTSNGLAAGTCVADAALRAGLELIERDAFVTSWRARQPGRRIRIDSDIDTDLRAIVDSISALGGQVELVLLESVCGYPVAVCIAFGDGINWPGATIGLAAAQDPRSAIRQAILEQGQTGPYLRRLLKTGAIPVPDRAEEVRTMLDHAAYYFRPERAAAFDYLCMESHTCSITELETGSERSLEAFSNRLSANGIRVALVDVTSADIAQTPFRVIRAVSPDLQPISFGHGLDFNPVSHLARMAPAISTPEIMPIW